MKVILALATMLAINMFLFLGQTGIVAIAQEEGYNPGSTLYNYEGSLISEYDTGNYNLTTITELRLPETEASIDSENNNYFVDSLATLKNWFNKAGTGWNYLKGIVGAVPNFLKSIGLPNEVSFALGFFWHGLTLFLIVMLIWGRQL